MMFEFVLLMGLALLAVLFVFTFPHSRRAVPGESILEDVDEHDPTKWQPPGWNKRGENYDPLRFSDRIAVTSAHTVADWLQDSDERWPILQTELEEFIAEHPIDEGAKSFGSGMYSGSKIS